MSKKKCPPDTDMSEGPLDQLNGDIVSPFGPGRKVSYYGKGVLISGTGTFRAGKHNRSKRGQIMGWSSSSRRRMRMFLLTHSSPMGWPVYGVTLTIPGPVLPLDQARKAFSWFCREAERKSWCFVWRVELQKRGAAHWHLVLSTPPIWHEGRQQTVVLADPMWVHRLWWEALRRLGRFTFDPPYNNYVEVSSLTDLPGALEHSCDVQHDGDTGAWMRYLQDHASKTKQEQIAVGIGRHWGVVGRGLFDMVAPVCEDEFTDVAQWSRFLRAFQRLITPSRRAPCVFGRRLGHRPSRGRRGNSVSFSRDETISRLVRWALSTPPSSDICSDGPDD